MSPSKVKLPVILDWYRTAGDAASLAALRGGYPCANGCSWCCHEPTLVTDTDVKVALHGLRLLPPEEQARLEVRVRDYRTALTHKGFDWHERSPMMRGLRTDPVRALALVSRAWPALPCPMLDPPERHSTEEEREAGAPLVDMSKGTCAIYEHRPLVCRTHHAKGPEGCKPLGAGGDGKPLAQLDARNVHAKARASFDSRPVGILGVELARALDAALVKE